MSRKKTSIAIGMAGATFGALLGATLGEWTEALEGAAIGGVLAALASRFFLSEQSKVAFLTGREADFYLNATPLIQKYIQHKVERGVKVEGHLHILPKHEFEQLAFEYLMERFSSGASLPVGTKPLESPDSDSYAQARETAQKTSAFHTSGEIYLHEDKVRAGTVIHESIHLFQDYSYLEDPNVNINEGITEYFTRLVCATHQITRLPKYPIQYECILKLVAVCGEEPLAEAYFQGNISPLQSKVDGRKGMGTFQMWCYFMKRRNFKRANKLL